MNSTSMISLEGNMFKRIYYGIFLYLFGIQLVDSACVCSCGGYTYYPSTTCSSASGCAYYCLLTYGSCTSSNTYGCCGSSCTYYGSYSTSPSYSGNCQCQCSTSSFTSTITVGSTYLSGCRSSSCQTACSNLYPLSCGIYTNDAYCSYSGTNTVTCQSKLLLMMIVVSMYSLKSFL